MELGKLKIALVHDFLNQYGGAERVLGVLHEIFPEAPIYTLLYDPTKLHGKFKDADIRTSFLQKFPRFMKKRQRYLLPFMPTAPETFNLRDFDLVISSSSAFAKGIIVKPKTIHISYCHSPMRYVWDWNEKYLDENNLGPRRKIIARMLLNYIRMWDKVAADRVDFYLANSENTAKRIKKYYGLESTVVYPPVGIGKNWNAAEDKEDEGKKEDFFLIVSRLSPYKKIEVAVEAMNKLNLPLIVIGEGLLKYKKYLHKIAGPKVRFVGWQSDEKIRKYYSECRAFLFPGEDDFGISAVEAMSFGKPVIALRRGGAIETIQEGITGEFFDESVLEVMVDAVRRFIEKEKEYDPQTIRQQAEKFSKEIFVENIKKEIGKIIEKSNISA
jgi:glycosyltransferase involved in cell wall biosynthesis